MKYYWLNEPVVGKYENGGQLDFAFNVRPEYEKYAKSMMNGDIVYLRLKNAKLKANAYSVERCYYEESDKKLTMHLKWLGELDVPEVCGNGQMEELGAPLCAEYNDYDVNFSYTLRPGIIANATFPSDITEDEFNSFTQNMWKFVNGNKEKVKRIDVYTGSENVKAKDVQREAAAGSGRNAEYLNFPEFRNAHPANTAHYIESFLDECQHAAIITWCDWVFAAVRLYVKEHANCECVAHYITKEEKIDLEVNSEGKLENWPDGFFSFYDDILDSLCN